MGKFKQFNAAAGTVDLCTVQDVAAEICSKHARQVIDHILNVAMESVVLADQDPESLFENVQQSDHVEYNRLEGYGAAPAVFSSPNQVEDSTYSRQVASFKPIKATDLNDVIAWIANEITSMMQVERTVDNISDADAIEDVTLFAIENFIVPTHMVKLKDKVWIAIDPQEIEVRVVNDRGTIKMCLFCTRKAMLTATEVKNEIEL